MFTWCKYKIESKSIFISNSSLCLNLHVMNTLREIPNDSRCFHQVHYSFRFVGKMVFLSKLNTATEHHEVYRKITKKTWHAISTFSSVTQLCPNLCDFMDCSTPDFPVHHQLSEPTQTHVHYVGDDIQPSHLFLLPSIFPSIRVFLNESVLCIRWSKY